MSYEKADQVEVPESSEIDVQFVGGETGESTKRNVLSNPEGLTPNVDAYAETPEQMLARVLLADESVIGAFDCFFPTFMLPRWKIVLLLIGTLGLYAFVLLFRAIRRCCYRNRCCTPSVVEFQRGKLAVTNKGRIICWSVEFEQKKIKRSCWVGCFLKLCCCCCGTNCDPAVEYAGLIKTKVYNAMDIRQISQSYESQSACACCSCCCWCCCLEYTCSVELSFNEFAHDGIQVGSLSTSPSTSYFGSLVFAVGAVLKRIEVTLGLNRDNMLYIFSKTEDMVHNGDVEKTIKDMNDLHKKVLEVLPVLPDVFVKNEELNAEEINKFEVVDGFSGITVVSTKGDISIPSDWLSLMNGESIITAHGVLFKMRCRDWFWTCISCGLYYCTLYRWKRFERTALILTNKRLIAIDIRQRAGQIPSHLGSFFVSCRSYFPGDIRGGYITSEDPKHLNAGIDTLGGHLSIIFYRSIRKSLPFAKSLMMTTSRQQSFVSIEKVRDAPSFDTTDMRFLPFLPNEVPFDVIKGRAHYRPCCYWSCCCCPPLCSPDYLCEKKKCKCCFPWLSFLLTCCIRPLKATDDIVITDMTVIAYVMERNWGIFGCFGALCPNARRLCCNKSKFSIAWAPITSITGYNSEIEIFGRENFCARICNGCYIGKKCCPIGRSTLTVDVDLGKYKISIADAENNKNWSSDQKLLLANSVLGRVQQEIILREHRSGKEL